MAISGTATADNTSVTGNSADIFPNIEGDALDLSPTLDQYGIVEADDI